MTTIESTSENKVNVKVKSLWKVSNVNFKKSESSCGQNTDFFSSFIAVEKENLGFLRYFQKIQRCFQQMCLHPQVKGSMLESLIEKRAEYLESCNKSLSTLSLTGEPPVLPNVPRPDEASDRFLTSRDLL